MRPMKQVGARVKVINAARLDGIEANTTATGNVDLYYDVNAPVVRFTDNLSGGVVVGLNTRNAQRGDEWTIRRDSAVPAAQTLTVKSGTAAGGTSLGVVSASKNGHVRAKFDGTDWKAVEVADSP